MSSKPKAQTRYSIQQTTSLIANLSNQTSCSSSNASKQQDSAATATTIQKSPKVTPFENPWILAIV
jgi:hypothetical protein